MMYLKSYFFASRHDVELEVLSWQIPTKGDGVEKSAKEMM